MLSTATRWWKTDTALHTFLFVQFLIGLPFFVFGTYSLYQMQFVGFLIGHDGTGQPCTDQTYCIVPWAGSEKDLNAIILYLNAFTFGLGGVVTLLLAAYSDYWRRKHILVTVSVALYGAFSIPAYWLQSYTLYNFNVLSALYILFQIITLVLMAILNIYIPHCMRRVQVTAPSDSSAFMTATVSTSMPGSSNKRRKYGFNMSLLGMVMNGLGGIIVYVIVIILTQTLSGEAAQSSGLLVSTIIGFITVAGSTAAYFGLPVIPSKPISDLHSSPFRPIIELFMPLKDLLVRKNMAALLISFTIWTDTIFAINSNISQLFIAEIRPGALEFSLYSLAQSLFLLGSSLAFLFIQPYFRIRLETWYIIGLVVTLVIPAWACIGIADVNFGSKMRWEFYIQLFLLQLAQAFVNGPFRVLLAEMIPIGSEIRWFGMQLVLSNATVWVNYIASAPLQNATHQLRFPLILSVVFLVVAIVVEVARATLGVFTRDAERWRSRDKTGMGEGEVGSDEASSVGSVANEKRADVDLHQTGERTLVRDPNLEPVEPGWGSVSLALSTPITRAD